MKVLSVDELTDILIKNELNYNSSVNLSAKQFFFNRGYIYVWHFYKNHDIAANKDFIDFLTKSRLYSKIMPLIINSNTSKSPNVDIVSVSSDNGIFDNVSDAICLRLLKIDNLVSEIKTLINK